MTTCIFPSGKARETGLIESDSIHTSSVDTSPGEAIADPPPVAAALGLALGPDWNLEPGLAVSRTLATVGRSTSADSPASVEAR
nr:uncharacterized protein CTRU02_04804 [Colletotrichum truncatum]KAF6795241.1 hypothetical protein CTRU02_04804 [Colletotrichum truncatum]